MAMVAEMVKPPIGAKVRVFYSAHTYTGEVVGHGPKYTKVKFKLKNGKVLERMAGVFPVEASQYHQQPNSLFATYNPDSFGNS